ncbi:hypothetical protein GUA87_09425 [Sneathiella sp. P13V-1]|uniref:hypothetical protein n=1 Tax=Sneathiella sp. P13V-1 TaxID=2697366 RepID=UPI00187B891C|nr:hypothetical protein [Sneathiella sp. P13V-1]MBE7637063.1 hypothetical protein [Sneathiella sp. P13V-1]
MADYLASDLKSVSSDLDVLFKKTQQLNREFSKNSAAAYVSGLSSEFNKLSSVVRSGFEKSLGSIFDVFLTKGGDAKDLVKALENDLLKLGNQYFGGETSKRSLGRGIAAVGGDLLSNLLPGFATGGSFTVGGVAGHDRNLVGLRLSRGERVDISTPAQQRQEKQASSQSQVINLNYNIQASDAASFRRSQSQIQTEALRNAQRLLKRNG